MAQETVGFIGLGVMGGPMAANVARTGRRVVGYDPEPARRDQAALAGVELAASCAEVARRADRTVVSVVRDWAQTEAALLGPEGVAAGGRAPLQLVVMSTLDPTSMRRLVEILAARGITAVEAPVSGGEAGAREGTLSVMTSGDREVLAAVRPLLDAMGRNVYDLGAEPGMGQAAKLANQLMLGVNMLGVFEGLRLARAAGVDEAQLMDMLGASTGGSWVTANWARVRGFWEGYVPGKEIDIILKDLRSALREADAQDLSAPVTAVAFQRLRHAWRSE